MAVTTTNLGVITAYGDAVAAGYTGTKAEWQALMASYATVGQQAVDAKNAAVAAKDTAVSKATEATTAANTATTKAGEASASAQSIAQSASQIAQNTSDISELKEDLTHAFPHDTVSGAVASFADGADDVPMDSVIVSIDPVQSGSGDPSPNNVRPISGWGEVNVGASGKNLLAKPFIHYSSVNVSLDECFFIKSGTYMFHFDSTNATSWRFLVIVMDGDGNLLTDSAYNPSSGLAYYSSLSGWLNQTNITIKYIPITIVKDCYIRILIASGDTSASTTVTGAQLELGTTPTAYEPYNGQSINIALGQTVYGGKLDVTNGVLTTYPYYASYNGETLTGAWISDRDKYVSGTTPTTGAQVINIGGAGTDIQLDPHEVRSLLGSNNVWADTGDSTVTYRADPTLYISRLTEPDADMVADANITSGSYFMVGNTLYKATANIASGGAITPNVNCVRKSLSEALNEINA